jgi:hypothetical protein
VFNVKIRALLGIVLCLPMWVFGEQACLAPEYTAGLNTRFSVAPVFPSLPAMPRLVQLARAAASDPFWYGVSQAGKIWRFSDVPSAGELHSVLDWSAQIESFGEAGLLGLAFHPRFDENSFAYIYYTPRAAISRLSRITIIDAKYQPDSELVLLEIPQRNINHNGGGLAFGADGLLYLSVGDGGGSGGDPLGHGQNTTTLLASMLRLDVDAGHPYGIPPDNPFADGNAGRPELFAWGLRNTWRWTFDPATGLIWGGDVGEKRFEEINIIRRGSNYGWNRREGELCRTGNCKVDQSVAPLHVYPHDNGECAVIGGPVLRQHPLAALNGRYLYADFCSGKVYSLPLAAAAAKAERELVAVAGFRVSAFARGAQGELYLLNLDGAAGSGVYQLQAGGQQTSELPARLSQLGCFADMEQPRAVASAWPYRLARQGWNQGERARYYASMPQGEVIVPGFQGDLLFPTGSVMIKNLYAGELLVETRLLMHHLTGWSGYSYAWNKEGSDAALVPAGGGEIRGRQFLSRAQCGMCHVQAARGTLGADLSQFASVVDPQGRSQLQQLGESGRLAFYEQVADLDFGPPIQAPAQGSLAAQARSYLHVNCSGCHRPDGAAVSLDLRRRVPLQETGLCDKPIDSGQAETSYLRLQPGQAQRSLLYRRMQAETGFHMPPLLLEPFDSEGLALIGRWIDSLSGC